MEEDEGAEMPEFNFGKISGDGSNSESEDEMEEKEWNWFCTKEWYDEFFSEVKWMSFKKVNVKKLGEKCYYLWVLDSEGINE